ncbi:MAG TPA: hypothetical protein VF528_15570 [Pyrinomonadaceae bacterium]|jgi:Zn-dependent protease with chaperone function
MQDKTQEIQTTRRSRNVRSSGHDESERVCCQHVSLRRVSANRRLSILPLWLAFLLLAAFAPAVVRAQDTESPWKSGTPPATQVRPRVVDEGDIVERAIGAACTERASDPLGSVPIDVMQARPSLPLGHADAIAGARRADRLLPVAKNLVVAAIEQLAREYAIDEKRVRAAALRVMAVNRIEPDVELRDNASVILSTPRTIYFGTIFLAGLPSDEGMVSVLAHELTHIADGREDGLQNLFRLVGRRAASLTGLRIYGRRPEELTCDLVGAMAARSFITRTPNNEKLARRLSRAVEHNCVEEDETDEAHLSPRNTMRALLALDPTLARDIIGDREQATISPLNTSHQFAYTPLR